MTQHELLEQLKHQVEAQLSLAEESLISSSEALLTQRPKAEKWNILECIQHLNQYAAYYIPLLEKSVLQAQKRGNDTYSVGWLGGKFIKMMSPENTKPQKTLKHMNTLGKAVSIEVCHEFCTWQQRLLKVISQLENKNINQNKIPVEFLKLIKLKIGDALRFVVVHQQRHFLQIKSMLSKEKNASYYSFEDK